MLRNTLKVLSQARSAVTIQVAAKAVVQGEEVGTKKVCPWTRPHFFLAKGYSLEVLDLKWTNTVLAKVKKMVRMLLRLIQI